MARSRFRGSEEVKIDAKGRVSIPAKFRRVFEAGDESWSVGKRPQLVIVHGTREWKHLQLYTMQAMNEIDEQISMLPRGGAERNLLENIYYGHADETEIDNDGRLLLSPRWRDKIGLTDSAVFISSGDSLKVWNPENYESQENALEDLVPNFEPGADPLSLLATAQKAEG